MAMTEGVGLTVPKPVIIDLTSADVTALWTEVRRRNSVRQYEGRTDTWGRGVGDVLYIPHLGHISKCLSPMLCGAIGEYATIIFINRTTAAGCEMDFRLLTFGDDGCDINAAGLVIDVKTRSKDYGAYLIRRINERGRLLTWKNQAFVFATMRENLSVSLDGWVYSRRIEGKETVPARRGSHFNVELQPEELLGMSGLIADIKSRL